MKQVDTIGQSRWMRLLEDTGNPATPAEPTAHPATTVIVQPRSRVNPSLREATDQSLNERMRLVSQAVDSAYNQNRGPGQPYHYVDLVWDDFCTVCAGGLLWKVPYTLSADGTTVTLGKAVKVRMTPSPIEEGQVLGLLADVSEQLLEATEGDAPKASGKMWGVLIIQEGLSKNRNHYGRKVLQEAAPLYEGANVYMDHAEEKRRYGRSTKDQAGFVKNVEAVLLNAAAKEAKESGGPAVPRLALAGTLCVTKPAVRQEMLDGHDMGRTSLFGLSHDVLAESVTVMAEPAPYYDVTRIESVSSVDLVTNAAAGGRVLRLVASNTVPHTLEGDAKMLRKMIEAIKASKNTALIAKLEALGANPTEDQVLGIYTEALTSPASGASGTPKTEGQPAPAAQPAAAATPAAPGAAAAPPVTAPTKEAVAPGAVQLTEAQTMEVFKDARMLFLENQLKDTSLHVVVVEAIRKRFVAQMTECATIAGLPTKDAITAAIKEQVDLFAKLAEDKGVVMPARGIPHAEVVKATRDQVTEALDAFFGLKRGKDPKGTDDKIIPHDQRSFRGLYVEITGDKNCTGQISEATRLTESLNTSSFDQILGDSITRRMVKDYAMIDLNNWRGTVAEVVPVSDFRTQRRMRFGGYGNLPTVGQGAPYTALTSPTDEEATYAPAKRGGTEQITLEMIINDDVGAIRRIPGKLARAAAQTLHEFVWDFLRTNAVVYDAVALAAAGHNNITTTALTSTNLNAMRLQMRKQTDMSNSKRVSIGLRYIIVPVDLEELAFHLTTADKALPDASIPSTAEPTAPNFHKRNRIQPIVVDYWTDTNDYWGAASPDQLPMIEIGFLNGKEEPEIFVQDMPNVGSMFSNDAITWKIKHTYGGGVLDYRGFSGGIVP